MHQIQIAPTVKILQTDQEFSLMRHARILYFVSYATCRREVGVSALMLPSAKKHSQKRLRSHNRRKPGEVGFGTSGKTSTSRNVTMGILRCRSHAPKLTARGDGLKVACHQSDVLRLEIVIVGRRGVERIETHSVSFSYSSPSSFFFER